MKKLRIGFDIDDVLVNSGIAMTSLHNKVYGTQLDLNNIYNLETFKDWGVADGQGIVDRIHEIMRLDDWLGLDTPIEGALGVLSKLKDEGHQLFAITGRPASFRSDTIKLLETYFPGIFSDETLFMTDLYAVDGSPVEKVTKLDIARELKLTHFVEDLLVHADILAEEGIKTVLFTYGYHWNQTGGHDSLVRLSTWREIGEFFEDECRD